MLSTLREETMDFSTIGKPYLASELNPMVTPTNWPYQKSDVIVWEPFREVAFTSWVKVTNAAQLRVLGISIYPYIRKKAPARITFRIASLGSAILEGYAEATKNENGEVTLDGKVNAEGIGNACYAFACTEKTTVDFGGGETQTHEPGVYDSVETKAKDGGNISITTETVNGAWNLWGGVPKVRVSTSQCISTVTKVLPERWMFVMQALKVDDDEKTLLISTRGYTAAGEEVENVLQAYGFHNLVAQKPDGSCTVEAPLRIVPFQLTNFMTRSSIGDDVPNGDYVDNTKPMEYWKTLTRKHDTIPADADLVRMATTQGQWLKAQGIFTDADFEPIDIPGDAGR